MLKLFPKSLYSRFLIMILFPIIIIQIVAITIFYERHWDRVSAHMKKALLSEVMMIVSLYDDYNMDQTLLKKINKLDLLVKISDLKTYQITKENTSTESFISFRKYFTKKTGYLAKIFVEDSYTPISMIIPMKDKSIIIKFSRNRLENSSTKIFVLWVVATSLLFGFISLVFLRNQIKSITKLKNVAKQFGRGRDEKFIPSGAKEIRSLGVSFLKMKKNISRQIKHRTELLNNIAHDLRTPITRIKLKLALASESDVIECVNKNVEQIENMISGYLNFAKQEGNETTVVADISQLLQDIVDSLCDNRIKLVNLPNIKAPIKIHAMERAITNILSNSIKYADKKILVALIEDDKDLIIEVDDDGDGVNEIDYARMLKPFTRLKNCKKEGYGLGMSIAKIILNAHGGYIKLAESKLGGLKVMMSIPK